MICEGGAVPKRRRLPAPSDAWHFFPVSGVVLCDHVRSQDWKERQWQPICQVPPAFVQEVLARTLTLFDLPAGG
jgi:mRNA-degrading endonuclease toxin of MazEF toxin-antitoxin module